MGKVRTVPFIVALLVALGFALYLRVPATPRADGQSPAGEASHEEPAGLSQEGDRDSDPAQEGLLDSDSVQEGDLDPVPAHEDGASDGDEATTSAEPSPQRTYTPWTEDDAPNYYRVVGAAQADAMLEPGEITYAALDGLGRSGRAVACVTFDMMEAGQARERSDMSSIHPSGWGHNAEVDIELIDGRTYHGYLYNRSHLIAKALGGADIRENLVTGTRMQNVGDNNPAGGMLFCEQVARDWLYRNPDGWVLYSATPVYQGDELLCRSVIVDMLSSDGTLDMQVEVYNAALGYEIDYATGEFLPEG